VSERVRSRRVPAGSVSDLGGNVVTVRLSAGPDGRPREAIVLADDGGIPRAYLNLCRHLPIPLDAATRRFLATDGMLQCLTHGARYRVEDGLCVSGPCRGASLYALQLHVEDGTLFVLDPEL
jgi:nitrite reductase/ring-hydroxylating ferredoxin subunit